MVVVLLALPWLGSRMVSIEPDNARAVADFHTAFNIVLALVFFLALLGRFGVRGFLRRVIS